MIMRLDNKAFNLIKEGTKKVELRLYDEKRRNVHTGDIITFVNRSNNEEIKVKVIYIHIYSSFKELYNDFDKISLGYKSNEISDYRDMYKYYSKELIEKYGVVGIEVELYEGDSEKRDTSYHQGITWPWLLGLYYNSLKNMLKATKNKEEKKELEEKINKFAEKTNKTFKKEICKNGCIGSISELYDSKKPYLPKGTYAQAWSVAEIFRIILKK